MEETNPYIGLEYKQTWMKGKGDWANILPKSYPGASLFVGSRFNENVGIELGYSSTKRKSKSSSTQSLNGVMLNNGANVSGSTKVKVYGAYFDINGYLPIDQQFDLIGSVGVALNKAKISYASNLAAGDVSTKSRVLGRLGFGAQAMVNEWVGVRAMARWENNSRLHKGGTIQFDNKSVPAKIFKDAGSLSLGAFVKF